MGFRSRFPSPRLIFPMPRINLDPFVHPRRALQSIRRDSAERWRHCVNGNAPCCLHVWPRWCLVILHAEYAMTGTCLWDDWRTIHVVRRIAMQDIARLPGSRMTRIGKSYLSFISLSLSFALSPPLFVVWDERHRKDARQGWRRGRRSSSRNCECIVDPPSSRQGRSLICGWLLFQEPRGHRAKLL